MKQKPPILSFNGGEYGKHSLARVDMQNALRGAEIMENIIPLVEGGMSKAPGSIYRNEAASSADDKLTIVRPWIFSEEQAFVLELSEFDLRFQYRDQGRVKIISDAATIGAWNGASEPAETGGGAAPSGGTANTGGADTGGYGSSGGSSGGAPGNFSSGGGLQQF